MTNLYLESIGLLNPTIVKRDNNGKIERLESLGLDMESLVAFWRRCFDLGEHLFEKITLHCKSKDFNAISQRPLETCLSVREVLAKQGVECVVDDEWFKGKEENDYKQKLIAAEERYDTLTKTSVEALEKKNEKLKESQAEIEILKLQNKKLAEAFDSLDKKYDSLKSELELDMKNVLEIEKKNAVKEFAQKIKAGVADYLYKTNFDGRKDNVVDMFELCEIVDNTVKEYENEQEK